MTYTLWGSNNLPKSVGINQSELVTTEVTPTRTIQVMKAGAMNVTATFLSPIDVRMSINCTSLPAADDSVSRPTSYDNRFHSPTLQ